MIEEIIACLILAFILGANIYIIQRLVRRSMRDEEERKERVENAVNIYKRKNMRR